MWPSNFYDLLRERDVEPLESVLVAVTPDQGCVCIVLVDQSRRHVSFELEYANAPDLPPDNCDARINDWCAKKTDGEDWWWKEHARMTSPKPNNAIFIALSRLDS